MSVDTREFAAGIAYPKSDVVINTLSDKIKDLLLYPEPDEIDSNVEASWHYFFGGGRSIGLGPTTTSRLENSDRQQEALFNLQSGNTSKSGNYGVDMTLEMFHVGDTTVAYDTVCMGGICTTVFTGFVRKAGNGFVPDGVWDVFDLEEKFGIEGVEAPYGMPYSYIPHVWVETYPDLFRK